MSTHVFIVGSKGIPAQYGGFETFVENLTARKVSSDIVYHVSCMDSDQRHFVYNGADCFNVRVPLPGAAGRILHVSLVLSRITKWRKQNPNSKAIVYILGCRIGPLLIWHARRLHRLKVKILSNPDGLEWKRAKWNALAKRFLLFSESCLVRNSDLVICDSKAIERYIREVYKNDVKETTFISYGADLTPSLCTDENLSEWYAKHALQRERYYLIVGRFVPENNYETIICEFMSSKTERDLVIISNVEQGKYMELLKQKTGFEADQRVKIVGVVYDTELLKKIRENAFAYIHGHEVGGTNPSLLEALASTKVNMLLDVGFNREVGVDAVLYWNKKRNSLADLIEKIETMTEGEINLLGSNAKNRIEETYSWERIVKSYEQVFIAQNVCTDEDII